VRAEPFTAQDWPQWLAAGYSYYQIDHIAYWAIAALVVLMSGVVWLAATRPTDWGLRVAILLPLILAQLLNLLGYIPPNVTPPTTAVAFWTRLAYLVSFPLLAVFAYRHLLRQTLNRTGRTGDNATLWAQMGQLLSAPNDEAAIQQALVMVDWLLPARFSGIALLLEGELAGNVRLIPHGRVSVSSAHATPDQWLLKLADWPALQLALQQQQTVTLRPDGLGARQLYTLYQELGLPVQGAITIEPMFTEADNPYGLLFLGEPQHSERWSSADLALLPQLATLLARALQLKQSRPISPNPHDQTLQQLQLLAERDQATQRALTLADYLQQSREQLQQAEAARQREQTLRLAAEAAANHWQQEAQQERVPALEAELATLREALEQAESSLTLLAMSDTPLNTDWVLRALTRYSADVEALQAQVQQLELQMRQGRNGHEGEQSPQNQKEKLTAVADVVDKTVAQLQPSLQEKQLRLDTHLDPSLPPLAVDSYVLQRILTILLHNAVLASPPKGLVRLVARAGKLQGLHDEDGVFRYAHLLVIDSGAGIPASWRPVLFSRQQRRANQSQPIPGLGDQSEALLEAQNLARMYGGRIWVDSQEQIGTAFSLLLPLAGAGGSGAEETATIVPEVVEG
jgi:signal transduction histidine kinase